MNYITVTLTEDQIKHLISLIDDEIGTVDLADPGFVMRLGGKLIGTLAKAKS